MYIKPQKETKTLNEWEFEKGIELRPRNRQKITRDGKISEGKFRRLVKVNYIVVKTEKGLEYLGRIK